MRTIGLLIVVLVGLMYLYTSFQPRLRFADPSPDEPLEVKRNYPCYHDQIYGGTSASDVLFFGASKTHHAVDAAIVEEAYKMVSGERLEAFAFDTPRSNPEIMYFFFRDYLANNPSPEIAFFSLTWVGPQPRPVRYIHPLFADLAPPDLYLDVLRSWEVVNHQLFAISDFLRLLIRHIDLSLSRLLLADVHFIVPTTDNCNTDNSATIQSDPDVISPPHSYARLLEAEGDRLMPLFERDKPGEMDSLLKSYADNRAMTSIIQKANSAQNRLKKPYFWYRGKKHARRHLDYFRRIVMLGEEHNTKVAFYYLPNIMALQPPAEEVQKVEKVLGAPVFILPFGYTRISYHHYKDPAHVMPQVRPLYSIWFASLVDQIREG